MAKSYTGKLTFSARLINHCIIILATESCYLPFPYTTLFLFNPAAGVIQSSPNPNCYGYNQIDAAITNSGTINIDYNLRVYTSAAASTNTGAVNISGGYSLDYYNGTLTWNSGAVNFSTGSIFT